MRLPALPRRAPPLPLEVCPGVGGCGAAGEPAGGAPDGGGGGGLRAGTVAGGGAGGGGGDGGGAGGGSTVGGATVTVVIGVDSVAVGNVIAPSPGPDATAARAPAAASTTDAIPHLTRLPSRMPVELFALSDSHQT